MLLPNETKLLVGYFTLGICELYSKGYRLPCETSFPFCVIITRICLLAGMSLKASQVSDVPKTTSHTCLLSDNNQIPYKKHLGGGRTTLIYWADIKEYVQLSADTYDNTSVFNFVEYADEDSVSSIPTKAGFVHIIGLCEWLRSRPNSMCESVLLREKLSSSAALPTLGWEAQPQASRVVV